MGFKDLDDAIKPAGAVIDFNGNDLRLLGCKIVGL
jgi:hypothetical protein